MLLGKGFDTIMGHAGEIQLESILADLYKKSAYYDRFGWNEMPSYTLLLSVIAGTPQSSLCHNTVLHVYIHTVLNLEPA